MFKAAYLVYRVNDPVNSRILANSLVLRVDEDDFEILVGRILVDPVAVEDSQVGTSLSNTFFGRRSQRSLVFELVDTLVGGLAVGCTLWCWPLATTTSNADTIDDIALFGLVSKSASFVGTRRS